MLSSQRCLSTKLTRPAAAAVIALLWVGCAASGSSEPPPQDGSTVTEPEALTQIVMTSPETYQAIGVERWELDNHDTADGYRRTIVGRDGEGAILYQLEYHVVAGDQTTATFSFNGSPPETDEQRAEIESVMSHFRRDLHEEGVLMPTSHSSCAGERASLETAVLAEGIALAAVTLTCTPTPLSVACALAVAAAYVAHQAFQAANFTHDCCLHRLPNPECQEPPPPPPDDDCSCHCSPCCGQGQCCI